MIGCSRHRSIQAGVNDASYSCKRPHQPRPSQMITVAVALPATPKLREGGWATKPATPCQERFAPAFAAASAWQTAKRLQCSGCRGGSYYKICLDAAFTPPLQTPKILNKF